MMVMDGAYGWVGREKGCDEDRPWKEESESKMWAGQHEQERK